VFTIDINRQVGKIPPTNFIQPTVPANRMDYDPKKLPSNSEGQALLSHNNENAISTDWNKHSRKDHLIVNFIMVPFDRPANRLLQRLNAN